MTSIRTTPSTVAQLNGRKIEFVVFCIGVLLFLMIPTPKGRLGQNCNGTKNKKEITI